MRETELHRIRLRREGKLVHRALDREDVHVGAEGAKSGDPQGHLRNEVMDDLGIGKGIERQRIAITATFRQRQRFRLGRGEGWFDMLPGEQGPRTTRPH
jgi:hypothetical protein